MTPTKTRFGKLSGRRSESGTAAIEFALFIPFLFILLVGTVDLGFAMYEAMQVSNAVEAGMLYAAKNGWDSAGITNSVLNASSVYPGGTPALTATPAPSQFCGCPQATGIAVATCSSTCPDGSAVSQYVQVNAALNHLSILSLPGLPVPSTFTAKAVVRVNQAMAPILKSRTRPRRSGAVAIEYGFVLPVLLLFIFGIIDIGRLLWTFTTLSRATEAAARCAAVNSTACANAGLIQNYAVGEAWGLDVTAAAFTVTQPACGKQVSATYTFQFVIPWFYGTSTFGSANTMTLSTTACYPPQYPQRALRKIAHQRVYHPFQAGICS